MWFVLTYVNLHDFSTLVCSVDSNPSDDVLRYVLYCFTRICFCSIVIPLDEIYHPISSSERMRNNLQHRSVDHLPVPNVSSVISWQVFSVWYVFYLARPVLVLITTAVSLPLCAETVLWTVLTSTVRVSTVANLLLKGLTAFNINLANGMYAKQADSGISAGTLQKMMCCPTQRAGVWFL